MQQDVETSGHHLYDAFQARDIEAAEELFAPDFIGHGAGTIGGLRESLTRLFTTYPEVHFVVEDLLIDGDRFALRMTIHGIPLAPNRALPTLMEFFRTENGRVIEVRGAGKGVPDLRQRSTQEESQEQG